MKLSLRIENILSFYFALSSSLFFMLEGKVLKLAIKYSIIIPVYNVKLYLNKCIDSIIEQNYRDLEIILIDDNSSDGCRYVCEEYSNKYDFVKVFRNNYNKGVSFSRNIGIQNASGKYIWFVDSDDYVEPDSFFTLDRILDEKGNLDILYFDFKEIWKDHKNIVTMTGNGEKWEFYGGNVWKCIYKTDFIKKLNLLFPVGVYCEDLYFNTIAVNEADSFEYVQILLYNYRRTVADSIMNRRSMKLIEDVLTITQRLLTQFRLKNDESAIELFVLNSSVGRLFDFLLFCILDFPENALAYHAKIIKTLNETGVAWRKAVYFNGNGNFVLKISRSLLKENFGVKILKTPWIRKLIKKQIDKNRV